MVGIGGILAVILPVWLCRLPVLFWFTVIALATAAGAAGATSLGGFVASRILNRLTASAAQGTGLLFISDMFNSKRTQALVINTWEFTAVLSPYIGPFFAGVLTTRSWRIPFWMYMGVTAFVLLGVIILGRETRYHPNLFATESKPLEFLCIAQFGSRDLRPSLGQASIRVWKTIKKPAVLLLDIYYLVTVAWIVSVSTLLLQPMSYTEQGVDSGVKVIFDMEQNFNAHLGPGPQGISYYSFGSGGQLGAFFLTPAFALVFSFGISHYLHHRIDKEHGRKNREAPPETRLEVIWVVQKNSHYMLVAAAWAMYVFGTLIITVGVATYQAEAFPRAAGGAGALISFAREFEGYIMTFVATKFAKGPNSEEDIGKGALVLFGAAVVLCALVCPIVVRLQIRGERMRRKGWDLELRK